MMLARSHAFVQRRGGERGFGSAALTASFNADLAFPLPSTTLDYLIISPRLNFRATAPLSSY